MTAREFWDKYQKLEKPESFSNGEDSFLPFFEVSPDKKVLMHYHSWELKTTSKWRKIELTPEYLNQLRDWLNKVFPRVDEDQI